MVSMNIKKISLVLCFLFVISVASAATCYEITQEVEDTDISLNEGNNYELFNSFKAPTDVKDLQLYKIVLDPSSGCKYAVELYQGDTLVSSGHVFDSDNPGIVTMSRKPILTVKSEYTLRIWSIKSDEYTCTFGGTSPDNLYYKLYFSSSGQDCSTSCTNADGETGGTDYKGNFYKQATCDDDNGAYREYCSDGTPIEYKCVDNDCVGVNFPSADGKCPYGCTGDFQGQGANCATAPDTECLDDDTQNVLAVKGTCTDEFGKEFSDTCDGKYKVFQYDCKFSRTCEKPQYSVDCGAGYECTDGACALIEAEVEEEATSDDDEPTATGECITTLNFPEPNSDARGYRMLYDPVYGKSGGGKYSYAKPLYEITDELKELNIDEEVAVTVEYDYYSRSWRGESTVRKYPDRIYTVLQTEGTYRGRPRIESTSVDMFDFCTYKNVVYYRGSVNEYTKQKYENCPDGVDYIESKVWATDQELERHKVEFTTSDIQGLKLSTGSGAGDRARVQNLKITIDRCSDTSDLFAPSLASFGEQAENGKFAFSANLTLLGYLGAIGAVLIGGIWFFTRKPKKRSKKRRK